MSINDKWDDLPNVVERLKAEAAKAPPRPRRLPASVNAPAAPVAARRDDWTERLTADDDRTIIRPHAVAAAAVAASGQAPARHEPQDGDDDDDDRDDDPDSEPTWPGVPDYDERAADPAPDPRQLLERLQAETDRALGPRAPVMHPLFAQLGRQLDELAATAAPPSAHAARLAAFTRALDKLEDLFSALMVTR